MDEDNMLELLELIWIWLKNRMKSYTALEKS